MSSHNHRNNNSVMLPSEEPVSERSIEYQDLYRTSPTANRAYEKFVARGSQHGQDVEDWLASEREILAEERERDQAATHASPPGHRDGAAHMR